MRAKKTRTTEDENAHTINTSQAKGLACNDATVKDPKLLADAARLHRPITPTSGVELQNAVKAVLNQPPEVVAELKKITGS